MATGEEEKRRRLRERIFALEGCMSECCVGTPTEREDDKGTVQGTMLEAGLGGEGSHGGGTGGGPARLYCWGADRGLGQKKHLKVAL